MVLISGGPKPVFGEGELKKLLLSKTLGMHTPKALMNGGLVQFGNEFPFYKRTFWKRRTHKSYKKLSFKFQKDDIG